MPPAHDLFSHPYADQPADVGDRPKIQPVSRANLFLEPAVAHLSSPDSGDND